MECLLIKNTLSIICLSSSSYIRVDNVESNKVVDGENNLSCQAPSRNLLLFILVFVLKTKVKCCDMAKKNNFLINYKINREFS